MAKRPNPIDALEGKMSLIDWRLQSLLAERDKVEATLKRKNLRQDTRNSREVRLTTLTEQINAARLEHADLDNRRYDLLYSARRN